MQEFIIGRDGVKNTLKISSNGKLIKEGGAVPHSVSRDHCKIIITDEKKTILQNIKAENVTYVNGTPIQDPTITQEIYGNDVIELGFERYKLNLSPFKLPKAADIMHLKIIWDNYEKQQEQIRIGQLRKNALRGGMGIFSMLGIALAFIIDDNNTGNIIRTVLICIGVVLILFTTIETFVNAGKTVEKEKRMKQQFQDRYICPNCKRFLGFGTPIDMLIKTGECPSCKTKFKLKN